MKENVKRFGKLDPDLNFNWHSAAVDSFQVWSGGGDCASPWTSWRDGMKILKWLCCAGAVAQQCGLRLLLACLLPAVLLSGCGDPKNTATIRYRVIVTAEVDGEIVEGSSVMEMSYTRFEGSTLSGAGGSASLKGEALVLDLKKRGTVYVLPMTFDKNSGAYLEVYQNKILSSLNITSSIGSLTPEDLQKLRSFQGRVPLNIENVMPLFVAFNDEATPSSIYEVDPYRLDAIFGASVRLSRIDLEVTNAPLTSILKARLPWLVRADSINWARSKPGDETPLKNWPLAWKMANIRFFGKGSW